ncbi:hypothetical protein AMJ80_09280 [bacterium SM23_31]|nr:MAG: hypothetical protein AMJ80_09280 [bacterium SM23_31]
MNKTYIVTLLLFVAPNGKRLFFTSTRPIDKSKNEADAYIAPDESYILFIRRDGINICFHMKNKIWSRSFSISKVLNSEFEDTWPRVSYDGKFIFFSSFRPSKEKLINNTPSIYWVSSLVIEEFRKLVKE